MMACVSRASEAGTSWKTGMLGSQEHAAEHLVVLPRECCGCSAREMVFGGGDKLPLTCCTLMIVFAMASVAIFLVLGRSTLWAHVSDKHGCC